MPRSHVNHTKYCYEGFGKKKNGQYNKSRFEGIDKIRWVEGIVRQNAVAC